MLQIIFIILDYMDIKFTKKLEKKLTAKFQKMKKPKILEKRPNEGSARFNDFGTTR